MFRQIKSIIDAWDPIELLIIHCPNDEYDEISMELKKRIAERVDLDSLANAIFDLFVQAFGIPTFNKSLDECRKIAQKIMECKFDLLEGE